jgi:hypothetical protein
VVGAELPEPYAHLRAERESSERERTECGDVVPGRELVAAVGHVDEVGVEAFLHDLPGLVHIPRPELQHILALVGRAVHTATSCAFGPYEGWCTSIVTHGLLPSPHFSISRRMWPERDAASGWFRKFWNVVGGRAAGTPSVE